jgi:hypothetical protein
MIHVLASYLLLKYLRIVANYKFQGLNSCNPQITSQSKLILVSAQFTLVVCCTKLKDMTNNVK